MSSLTWQPQRQAQSSFLEYQPTAPQKGPTQACSNAWWQLEPNRPWSCVWNLSHWHSAKRNQKKCVEKTDDVEAYSVHLHHALPHQAEGAPPCTTTHHSSTYFIEPCLVLGPLEQLICWVAAGLSLHGTPAAEAVNNSIHNTQLSWPPGRFIIICAFLIIIAPCFYPSQLPTTKHLPRCHHHLAKIIIMYILRTLELLFQTAPSANLLPEHSSYVYTCAYRRTYACAASRPSQLTVVCSAAPVVSHSDRSASWAPAPSSPGSSSSEQYPALSHL